MRPLNPIYALITLVGLAVAAPAWAAPEGCSSRPSTSATVQQALDLAQIAYNDLDDAGFRAAVDRALEVLPCLEEPMPRPVAANLHRYVGIAHFLERDHNRAQMAFAAAKSIEPNYRFPESFIPNDNPLLDDYDAPAPSSPLFEAAPALTGGYYTFDGSPGTQRPADRPTIAQVMRDDGSVAATGYLRPGYSLLRPSTLSVAGPKPGSTTQPPAAPSVAAPATPPTREAPEAKRVLKGVTIGLASVGTAFYLGAQVTKLNYTKTETLREAERAYAVNHALGWGGVVLPGLALATGVTLAVAF